MNCEWNQGYPDFGTECIGGEYEDDEFWSPIDGEKEYWISTHGRVWSSISEKLLKPFKTARYPSVAIHYSNGRRVTSYIHRIMAEAFIPNREKLPCVRHLNDNPDDFDLDNLAWGTQEDNVRDMFANGGDLHKEVYCLEDNKVYRSCAQLADILKVSRSAITMCCQGKIKTVAGKHLCYADERKED